MSKMKKILAVLLTVIMTVAMTVTAFAEGTQNRTITISGIGFEGSTLPEVKYGQIIEPDTESTLGWRFTGGNNTAIAIAFVNAWNGVTNPAGQLDAEGVIAALIELGRLENVHHVNTEAIIPNYNVENGIINSSAAFGAALAAVKDYATSTMNVTTGATNVATGLYIVTAQKDGFSYLPMAAYMNTAGDDVAIQAKGSEDQVQKKVADGGESVAKDDKVQYTVTAQYPYYSADAENKLFKITDTLENATFASDYKLVVKIDDKVVNTGYAAELTANNKLEINFTYDAQYAGKEVKITYTATVGDVSSTKPLKNSAKSEIAKGATKAIVESDTVKFVVTKIDDKNNTPLNGAEFTLYKEDNNGTETIVVNGEQKKVTIVATKTTEGTNANNSEKGEATFDGLDAQAIYYVKETKAPTGYSLNDNVYSLGKVTGSTETTYYYEYTEAGSDEIQEAPTLPEDKDVDNVVKVTKTTYTFNDFASQTITDTKLSALPSTGGIGTTIFTVAGCLIMICAAGLLFASRRKSSK